ncbi:MAG: FkbM family methyltransferase, partial [Rhodanobacter sp.]
MNTTKLRIILALRQMGNLLAIDGHFRIPQTLLWYFLRRIHMTIQVSDFDGDLTIPLQLSEHMQRRIFWLGYYNLQIIPYIKSTLLPGMTFIDIGANIGEVSMAAAKCVGRDGKVIAFEPIDAIANELQSNAKRNHLNQITVVRAGVSDSIDDNVPIYASCAQGHPGDENKGLGSIFGDATGQASVQRITTTTLDAWLETHPLDRLDMIKIDIEGAELPCLRGSERTLRRFKPTLIVEVQDITANAAGYRAQDILDYLSKLGYTFWRLGSRGHT